MLSARNTSITSNFTEQQRNEKKMPSKTILLCASVQTNRWTFESCVRNWNWFLLDICQKFAVFYRLNHISDNHLLNWTIWSLCLDHKHMVEKKQRQRRTRLYSQSPQFAKHFTKYFMTLEKWDVQQCLRGNCCNCWQRKICFCTENGPEIQLGKSIVLILIFCEMFAFQWRASLLSKLLVLILRNIFGMFFCGLVCCSFFFVQRENHIRRWASHRNMT